MVFFICKLQVKGADFVPNERMRILAQGTLFIKDVIRQDAGDYTCVAENSIAKDSITHKLTVLGKMPHDACTRHTAYSHLIQ